MILPDLATVARVAREASAGGAHNARVTFPITTSPLSRHDADDLLTAAYLCDLTVTVRRGLGWWTRTDRITVAGDPRVIAGLCDYLADLFPQDP